MEERKRNSADLVARLTQEQAEELERWMVEMRICKRGTRLARVMCWEINDARGLEREVLITSEELSQALANLVQRLDSEHQEMVIAKAREILETQPDK